MKLGLRSGPGDAVGQRLRSTLRLMERRMLKLDVIILAESNLKHEWAESVLDP